MASGTTRNENLHALLNTHYHTTIAINKATLSAEVNTWLTAEMGVFLRALTAKFTRRVGRCDLKPFTTEALVLFDSAAWRVFIIDSGRIWEPGPAMKSKKTRRQGPTSSQLQLVADIQSKLVKRPTKSVYRGAAGQ